MNSIIYIFFVVAHFSLYGNVKAAKTGFICDLPADNKPSEGVCSREGIKPDGGSNLIYYILEPFNAGKRLNNKGGFSWTCDEYKGTVSYCCVVAPDRTSNLAAACRRQVSA
ncbi:hypothetical protein DFH28DRAFT_1220903 [Melampsora americana]|nr:hypothetical protein DFH28DRAFT_1220903 [Melampsora americana]